MKKKKDFLWFLFIKPKLTTIMLLTINIILLFIISLEIIPIFKNIIEPPVSYKPANVSMVSEGIYAEAGVSKSSFLKIEEALKYLDLPKKYEIVLVKEIPEILLVEGNYLAEEGIKYITYGMSVYEANEIYIKDAENKNVTGFVIHELAHVYDRAMFEFSKEEDFNLLYEKYKNKYETLSQSSSSDYITSKNTEFFAGMMTDYILERERFEDNYPDLAIYAEKCYKKMKQ